MQINVKCVNKFLYKRGVELALSLSGKQIKRECGAILESIRVIN